MPHTEQCFSTTTPMADTNQSVWHQVTNVSPPAGTHACTHPPTTVCQSYQPPGAQAPTHPLLTLVKKENSETLPYSAKMIQKKAFKAYNSKLKKRLAEMSNADRNFWALIKDLSGLSAARSSSTPSVEAIADHFAHKMSSFW